MNKRILPIILLLAGAAAVLFFLRGDEDSWICVNEVWEKHGNPSASQPTDGCGLVGSSVVTTTVKVYFANTSTDPNFLDCSVVSPVERGVTSTLAIGRAALQELLKGPTVEERNRGFFTGINSGVDILSLEIIEGVATVDFSKKIEEAVGGSCRIATIYSQIENTLKQFPTVKSVIIKVEGRADDVLQP